MAIPIGIYPEWITVGPFMVFVTVTLTERTKLSAMEWSSVWLTGATLLFGFCLSVSPTYPAALFFVIVSVLCYLPTLYMPFYLREMDLCELPAPEGASWALRLYDPRLKRFYMMTVRTERLKK